MVDLSRFFIVLNRFEFINSSNNEIYFVHFNCSFGLTQIIKFLKLKQMKKESNKLQLHKIKITKLNNLRSIVGGTSYYMDDDDDDDNSSDTQTKQMA